MPSTIKTLAASLALAWMAACTSAGTGAGGSAGGTAAGNAPPPGAALRAYANEAELSQALDRWRTEAARRQADRRRESSVAALALPAPAPGAAPAAATAKAAPAAEAGAPAADGITNVQTAGVDEGGIVKRAGDHLVVLRRGRLFTLRIGGDALQPVSAVDAYAPNADPRGAWYDELLISGSTVVVVGFSYARGGTEIGLFELDAHGGLHYRATHHLRSNDYYAARNYASRLVGRQLVFYSPQLLQPWGPPPLQGLPGQRRWTGQAAAPTDASWQRILPATRIFRSDDDFDPAQPLALHTVTRCDIDAAELRCQASAVLGPAGRVFYVSQASVYVWTAMRATAGAEARSVLFRLPLDAVAPTAIKTVGVPIDQFSFLEDGQGHLNVLLRASGTGEGMWGPRTLQGQTALLRLPLTALGDGTASAAREHYRLLAAPQPTQNRYVGDWLLLGRAQAGERDSAWALRYADPRAELQPLATGHGVERIEALGRHAVLVGNAGNDLNFSAVRLDNQATLAGQYVQPAARQGETRSHGFYYLPTAADQGLLGLPVLASAVPARGAVYRAGQGAASVLFLREQGLAFRALGSLQSQPVDADDACKASCVDWYGNARPLFVGPRVFALLGYELVEGRLDGRDGAERLLERRRISFAPQPAGNGRPSPFAP